MHELSIAQSIIETIEESTAQYKQPVSRVILEIGKMSGVIPEALRFALDELKMAGKMAKSEFIIEETDTVARCTACGFEFNQSMNFEPCPKCQNPFSDIVKGNELIIKKIIL